LGITYFRATKFCKAVAIFEKLLEGESDLYMAYYWMGLAYYHTGKIQKSIDVFEKLRSRMPHNSLGCYHLAISYKAKGENEKAIKCFLSILTEDDTIVSVNYHLALAYIADSQINNGVKYLKRVIELDSEHKAAKKQLSEIYNDQDMLYNYGIESSKDKENPDEINMNYYIGQAYKGFDMINKTFNYLKKKVVEKDDE